MVDRVTLRHVFLSIIPPMLHVLSYLLRTYKSHLRAKFDEDKSHGVWLPVKEASKAVKRARSCKKCPDGVTQRRHVLFNTGF